MTISILAKEGILLFIRLLCFVKALLFPPNFETKLNSYVKNLVQFDLSRAFDKKVKFGFI